MPTSFEHLGAAQGKPDARSHLEAEDGGKKKVRAADAADRLGAGKQGREDERRAMDRS
jgi:hypothetical protein